MKYIFYIICVFVFVGCEYKASAESNEFVVRDIRKFDGGMAVYRLEPAKRTNDNTYVWFRDTLGKFKIGDTLSLFNPQLFKIPIMTAGKDTTEKPPIVTDEEIDSSWGNANFGDQRSKRDVIYDTCIKYATGYESGRTARELCKALGLLQGVGIGEARVTEKGMDYIFEYRLENEYLKQK